MSRDRRAAGAVWIAVATTVGFSVGVWLDRHQILAGARGLGHLRRFWMFALPAETLSMLGYVSAQRLALKAGGERIGTVRLLATAYPASAVSMFVPFAGSSLSAGYTLVRWRRHGVDEVRGGAALAVAEFVSFLSFALLTIAGAILSGQPATAASSAAGAVLVVTIGVWLAITVRTSTGRERVARVGATFLFAVRRVTGRPRTNPYKILGDIGGRLAGFRFRAATLPLAFGASTLYWLANAVVLASAVAATGAEVPWQHILLIWSAGLAAATLTPVPGGVGVVEVALTAALVAVGLTNQQAVTAVLLYRLVSFQLLRTLIWTVSGYLAGQQTTHRRAADNPPTVGPAG